MADILGKGKAGRQTSLLDIPIVKIRLPEMPRVPKIADIEMPVLIPKKKDVVVKITGPKREAEIKISPAKREAEVKVKTVQPAVKPKEEKPMEIPKQKTIQELKKEKQVKAKKRMAAGPGDAAMYPPPKHNAKTDEWVGKVHVHPITIANKKTISIAVKFDKPDYWIRNTADKLKGFIDNMDEIQKILKNPSKKHDGKIKVWQLGDERLITIDIPISHDKRFMVTVPQARGIIANIADISKAIRKYSGGN